MPEGQPESLPEDISRQFSEALEPLDLYEKNPEIGKRMKEKLDTELDDEWKAKLLTFKNPVELLRALHKAGIAEEMDPGLRNAVFAFVNKRQNANARENADRVLADRDKTSGTQEEITAEELAKETGILPAAAEMIVARRKREKRVLSTPSNRKERIQKASGEGMMNSDS